MKNDMKPVASSKADIALPPGVPADYYPLSALLCWDRNYRHGAVPLIAASLQKFGFNGALRIWNAPANGRKTKAKTRVVAGNHTKLALDQLRVSGATPPTHVIAVDDEWYIRTVDVSHLSKIQAQVFLIEDNHVAEKGDTNFETLSILLREIVDFDKTLLVSWEDYELDPLLKANWAPAAITDLPGGASNIKPIHLTESQRKVFERACVKVRKARGDADLVEGACVELMAREYLRKADA